MYWSGLQKDAGEKETQMEGARKLKQDIAFVYLTWAEANPRQLLLTNAAWLCPFS
jgi:hypothetical protein